uniref:transposase n=1 Tax=Hymenobacter siberiensis TaxID=2848396 RepID=UPI001C1DDF0B|nr:transposase [Hymenobacter siberiensis]
MGSTTTYGPADIWRQAKPLIRQAEARRPAGEFAVLIVDDSVLEKAHADANELICSHWDHSQQRYVKGLNFVTLLYQAGELALSIAVELVRKPVPVYYPKTQQTSYQSPFTKNEYLQQMLRVAQPQVAYRYLLADSWYASAENMCLVRALGHHFVFALESSRTVALSEADRAQGRFQAVQTLVFPDTQPLRVYLRSVQEAVLVTRQVFTNQDGSQGVLYLVSSDTDLDQAQLTTIYQGRWKSASSFLCGRVSQVAQTECLDGQGAHQNPGHAGHPFLRCRAGLHQTRSPQAQMRHRPFSP